MSAKGTGSKRKRVKIVQITVDGVEVDAKECTKCGEVKALADYHVLKQGLGGRMSACRECSSEYKRKRYIPIPEDERMHRCFDLMQIVIDGVEVASKECGTCNVIKPLTDYHNKKNGLGGKSIVCRECVIMRDRKYYETNTKKVCERSRNYYEDNLENVRERHRKYLANNPEVGRAADIRRRAVKLALVSDWTTEHEVEILKTFSGACALSEATDNIHMDHVIPLTWGHGGSYFGNMIPLTSTVNISKFNNHFYEWFEANRQRFNLDQSRFDAVVADLANQNGLTPDEYRQYVDWCFANKRSLDEIIAYNKRYGYVVTSVELWRDSTGMQLPLRFDNREQAFVSEEAS